MQFKDQKDNKKEVPDPGKHLISNKFSNANEKKTKADQTVKG